jgi:hypothetical protein
VNGATNRMGRTAKALTMAQIRRLPRGMHAVGGPVAGLVVQVGAADRRWKLRRYVGGVQRAFDLGALDELALEAAQAAAAELVTTLTTRRKTRKPPASPSAANDDNPFLGPIARELLATSA